MITHTGNPYTQLFLSAILMFDHKKCPVTQLHRKPMIRTYRRSLLGFTLIELLVVIAVISMLVALVLPEFSRRVQPPGALNVGTI